jgi:fructokinase
MLAKSGTNAKRPPGAACSLASWLDNRAMAGKTPVIVGLGEALFDLFPDSARLGGAPLNVAVHAHQLGNQGMVLSRVGRDEFGAGVLDELRRRGMSTDYIQQDPDRATGTVKVDLDAKGEPTFTIAADVAWDSLEFDAAAEGLAMRCDAVCFGTLAQRDGRTRLAIHRFVQTAGQAVRLFDVNIRQRYYDEPTIRRSCELATAVKLNASELTLLTRMLDLGGEGEHAAAVLREKFGLMWVAVTRGERGTAVYAEDGRHEGETVAATPGGDAVGAGDATAAALLHGAVRGWNWDRTLALANALGAHVASQTGACPPHTPRIAQLAR